MSPTPVSDLFTIAYVDLDAIAARTFGRAIPADFADEIDCARAVLADHAGIRGPKACANAFRAEHGFETLKGLWFAFADHAALRGLQLA